MAPGTCHTTSKGPVLQPGARPALQSPPATEARALCDASPGLHLLPWQLVSLSAPGQSGIHMPPATEGQTCPSGVRQAACRGRTRVRC